MTVKNEQFSKFGIEYEITWDMSLTYGFVYADDQIIFRGDAGVTLFRGRVPVGAVLQVVDSATATPDPAPVDPQPKRYMYLKWYPVSDPDVKFYKVYIDQTLQTKRETGDPFYEFTSPRLSSGNRNFLVRAEDNAGNLLSVVSSLTMLIESPPPPATGIILSQSVPASGDLDLTLITPSTW